MSTSLAFCILAFLLSASLTLATYIEPRTSSWTRRGQADGLMQRVFGEGRRLFANHFFVQADVYFHSGYYPSVFDQQLKPKDDSHLKVAERTADGKQTGHEGHAHGPQCTHGEEKGNAGGEPEHHAEHVHGPECKDQHGDHSDEDSEHYRQMALGKPRDWVESFGRRFTVTTHNHLSNGNEREMLPWLKLSAEMDPQRIDTYTVASYWLVNMGRTREAEDFLRLGLRHNPDSYELLTELALLLERAKRDSFRARNLLRLALIKWDRQEAAKEEPDLIGADRILVRLAKLESAEGNKPEALEYLRRALKTSPAPEAIQRQIQELERQ